MYETDNNELGAYMNGSNPLRMPVTRRLPFSFKPSRLSCRKLLAKSSLWQYIQLKFTSWFTMKRLSSGACALLTARKVSKSHAERHTFQGFNVALSSRLLDLVFGQQYGGPFVSSRWESCFASVRGDDDHGWEYIWSCLYQVVHQQSIGPCNCARISARFASQKMSVSWSFAVKAPQIFKFVKAKSCEGVSLVSQLQELAAYTLALSYNFSKGFPFR